MPRLCLPSEVPEGGAQRRDVGRQHGGLRLSIHVGRVQRLRPCPIPIIGEGQPHAPSRDQNLCLVSIIKAIILPRCQLSDPIAKIIVITIKPHLYKENGEYWSGRRYFYSLFLAFRNVVRIRI
jgi:hypothetical protein